MRNTARVFAPLLAIADAATLLDTRATAGDDARVPRVTVASEGPARAGALCLDDLARMSWPELEALYRQSPAGEIPRGFARGLAIYCPDGRLARVRSATSKALWRGKVFDCAGDSLVNQWCGVRAIRAAVCYGPSWLDGGPSIVMDYSGTSHVWSDVRDEAREVAPGVYLGRMYRRTKCGPRFMLYFALEVCPPPRDSH